MSGVVDQTQRFRAGLFYFVLGVVFLGLLGRLFQIQVLAQDQYRSTLERQSHGEVRVAPLRGTLLSREGDVLAVSTSVESVFADPTRIKDREKTSSTLAHLLHLDLQNIRAKLEKPVRFVWVKRKVLAGEARGIRAAKLEGVGLQTEFDRTYIHGSLACHVIGDVDPFEGGTSGIERRLDSLLLPKTFSISFRVDGTKSRRPIEAFQNPLITPGRSVRLTLHLPTQRIFEEEVDSLMAEWRPKWAVALGMDPFSGRILAMTCRPNYDPNDSDRFPLDSRRCRAVTDPYEPGSTLKALIAAIALEERVCTPSTVIDCEMGVWRVGSRTLHDHHPYGRLTFREIISKSSNIGAAKIGYRFLGLDRMYRCVRAFGFGQRTGIEIPGEPEESAKLVKDRKNWSAHGTGLSVPIGHEIMVTPLQLAVALSALANGGLLLRPYCVERVEGADEMPVYQAHPRVVRRVISSQTAATMREILKDVVVNGTGREAAVPGLSVAGKTGTTQKKKRGQVYGHISSFVGFAPADRAKMCVVVVVDEPQGAYYGGAVAAPTVRKILERSRLYWK